MSMKNKEIKQPRINEFVSLKDSVWDSVYHSVLYSVWDLVWSSLRNSVGDLVYEEVREYANR